MAYFLGVLEYTILTIILLMPYRAVSGGFHLKTHIGCIISTTLYYCGIAKISIYYIFTNQLAKILATLSVWIFGMIMVKLYAPADTENVPILRKQERRQKQIFSYIILTIEFVIAILISNTIIAGIIIFGDLIQTLTITRLAYNLTNNKYGHEVYANI